SSAIWQSNSILITPPEGASRRLFEMKSLRKFGARLSASIADFRPPVSRRNNHRRRDAPECYKNGRRNKNAFKHGLYAAEAIAWRRKISALMRAARALARTR